MNDARTALITGGNTGLGEQAALHLARLGWTVVLACRSVGTGEAAAGRLRTQVSGAAIGVLPLDLGDLDSVRRLAEGWAGDAFPPLRAVVANAGIQYPHPHARTAQGFEATFGVNHLGHLLLLDLLLPHLAEPARVVFVGSGTHDPRQGGGYPPPYDASARALAFPDQVAQAPEPEWRAGMRRYASSKLANAQTAFHLSRLFRSQGRRITVNVFDPGLMPGTGLTRGYGGPVQLLWKRVLPVLARLRPDFASTPVRSGDHLAQLVDGEKYQGMTGRYFVQGGRKAGPQLGQASDLARDPAKARLLWEESLVLVGQRSPSTG
ncbi:SDR family NAD(P)-dependent oxidoreductase [Deinococcus planocerae]|uniref:SDR family NAD(P)-dependent oxidoreductase n=1 Tax=Deinococcus planocerae TaxID=1737569 RepID=UPI000C7F7843|nr:SDR family NAD(P)-dependent oxidoreductase [Deinococcus planocerae]